jgi:CheY-like chemotaxis protein
MSKPTQHRILIVDDDESVRDVFTLMLREKGYEVATAENGFDALLKLKDVIIPDVIISDLNCRKCPGLNSCPWYDAASQRFQ